jgi:predicted MFS family arabinose efflux permease
MFALFHSGNLVGLALSPLIIQNYGWHALFFTYGIAGLPLLALWYLIMPEAAPSESSAQSDDATPAYTPPGQYSPRIPPGREVKAPDKGSGQSRGANSPRIPPGREANAPPSTRATASAFPVREGRRGESLVLKAPSVEPGSITDFLQHPPVLAIAVANVANHWGYFIFQAWIPAFFAYEFGFNIAEASMMAFAPWIAMAVGSAGAGVLADHLITRMPVRFHAGCGRFLAVPFVCLFAGAM